MATAPEMRDRLQALATDVRDLSALPEERRPDTYAADLRNKTAEINATDALVQIEEREQDRQLQELAFSEALAKRALDILDADKAMRGESRGPSAAFGDLQGHRSFVQELTDRPEYRSWVESGAHGAMPELTIEGRTLLDEATSSATGPINWVTVGQPIPPTPRQLQFFVRDLIPVTQTNLAVVPYFRELNPATTESAATGVAEAAVKPEAVMTFVAANAVTAKIAAWIPATMEILQDAPTLQGYINARLTYMIQFREQQQILQGDGTGGDLAGIDTYTPQTTGATNNDAIVDFAVAIGKVENVDGNANGIVMNPTDYWAVMATRRSTWFDANTSNVGNAPFMGPPQTIWGLPVVRTRTLSSLTAYVADWTGAMIFDRMQTTVRQSDSHDTFFIYNKVAILAEERIALAVFRPDFFVKTTIDITA